MPILRTPAEIPLLIGCDCSIVVGTTHALARAAGDVHVLYIDGDFDDAPPDPARCQSAAAMAVWLLTRASAFWPGPPLRPSQVTVIGWTNPSQEPVSGVGSVPLTEIRRAGARAAAQQVLGDIPASTSILVHFDIDVLRQADMPAAYFPHREGLSMSETTELLGVLLGDPRVRLVEIAEYAALRDLEQRHVRALVDLLVGSLRH